MIMTKKGYSYPTGENTAKKYLVLLGVIIIPQKHGTCKMFIIIYIDLFAKKRYNDKKAIKEGL